MVCIETGQVLEFHNDEIERLQKKVADELGFELTGHNLVLYGKPKVNG
jgi:Fur family ferric uptake transcriptional regulator